MQTKIYFSGGGGGYLGCLGRPTPPPGGRAGSENNTLLPMTMICDRLKFWSGAVLGGQKLSSGNLGAAILNSLCHEFDVHAVRNGKIQIK